MHVGFTGTQQGLTLEQRVELARVLYAYTDGTVFHHGDCIGADDEAHDIARDAGYDIEIHPPINDYKRAWRRGGILHEPKEYLDRNHDIVDACDVLIAAPAQVEEVMRSGTWATVRYARKLGKPVVMIFPKEGREMTNSTTFDTNVVQDDFTFIGKLAMNQYEQVVYNGESMSVLHVAVEPLGFKVKGDSPYYHKNYKHVKGDPIKKKAAINFWFEGMKSVYTREELSDPETGEALAIDDERLLNLPPCRWVRKDISYGFDEAGKEIKGTNYIYPIARAPESFVQPVSEAPGTVDRELSPQEVEAVLSVLGEDTFDKRAAQMKLAKAISEDPLRTKVMNGSAWRFLEANELILPSPKKGEFTVAGVSAADVREPVTA